MNYDKQPVMTRLEYSMDKVLVAMGEKDKEIKQLNKLKAELENKKNGLLVDSDRIKAEINEAKSELAEDKRKKGAIESEIDQGKN